MCKTSENNESMPPSDSGEFMFPMPLFRDTSLMFGSHIICSEEGGTRVLHITSLWEPRDHSQKFRHIV